MDATAPGVSRRWLQRGRVTAYVGRHRIVWELAMGVLAACYLAVSFLVDDGNGVWGWLIGLLGGIFVVEFAARCFDAPSRRLYARQHWLDIVSAIPLIGGLRSVRLLRLLRLGAGLRVLVAAEELSEPRGGRRSLWYVGPALIVLWFAAACAYWIVEHGANSQVHNFADALYWAFITATTVGYGSVATTTAGGRILAGVVIFIGIGLVGFASARITEQWLREDADRHPRLMLEKMTKLESDIAALSEMISSQQEEKVGVASTEAPGRPATDSAT